MAELRYKVFVDDAEAKRKIAALLKGTGVSGQSGEAKKTASSIDDVRAATVKLKEAQLANIEALRQARLEQAKQKKDQADLNERYKQGQIDLQQFRLEQAKLTAEQKAQAKSARELKKQLADNSEYAKLTRALNNVRKETKDVLAEMFKLERQGYKSGAGYEHLRQKSDALTKQTVYLDNAVKRIDASVGQHQRKVGDYGRAMDNMIPIMGRLNSQLSVFGVTLDDLAKKPGAIREIGTAFVGVGKSLLNFLVSPVGLAISALGGLFMLFQRNKQTVIDFNSGLRDVSKTTGMAGDELTSFGDAILDLSSKLKVVSADKLLEYAAAAGQLGVRGRADILAFTEAMAMLETASDIGGEEGATEIARMLTLVDGGVQNVKQFGDEIVNLGNNFAATEKEILSNAEQIAQNVGIYKIGRQDVLAFATATKAVGLEAELVGSTFSRTLGEFEKTIRSGKGVADLLKVIGGTSAELSKRFKDDAAGVFVDYVRGLNNIQRSGGSVNEALERTGVIAVRDQRVIASLAANGFDVLTDALNNVRNANGAMQEEFENGASKLANQSKRMGIAWDNFVLSIENGEGAIAGVILRLIDGLSTLIEMTNKAFSPTSWEEFTARLYVDNATADKIREINKAMAEGESQVKKLSNFDQTKASQGQLNSMLKETTSTIDQVRAAYKQYKADVNAGILTEKGRNTLKEFEETLSFLQKKQWHLSLLVKPTGHNVDPNGLGESEEDRLKRERAEEKARQAAERSAEQRRQATERQRALQLQIDQINDQVSRNMLSRDQQEIASVRDKYAKIREEVRKFYADPKNKGLRVDIGGLNTNEAREVADARERQASDRKIKQYEQDYQNYVKYEELKIKAGEKYADEQYGAFKDTVSRMQGEMAALQGQQAEGTLSPIDADRLKWLEEQLEKHNQTVKEKNIAAYAEALQLSMSHDDRILAAKEKYQSALVALGVNATEDQKRVLKEGLADEISQITIANLRKEKDWEKTFNTLQFLSKKASNAVLDDIQKRLDAELKAGKLSRQDYDRATNEVTQARSNVNLEKSWIASTGALDNYRKKLKDYGKDAVETKQAQSDMFTALSRDLQAASQIIGDIGGFLGSLGASDGLQETIGKVANLAGSMSELAAGIASGNPIAIISGSIKTLTQVIDLFNTKDKKIQKQIDAYQKQLDSLSNSYARLQDRITNSVGESFYSDSRKQIQNLKERQKVLEQMANAEADKKKTDQSKVQAYWNEYNDIPRQIQEIERAITESLVQTSFKDLSNGLANALVSAFEAGEDAIDSMDKVFDKFIKNALVNSLKLKFLEEPIKKMTDDLAKYMLNNGNSLIGFNFDYYKGILEGASNEFTAILDQAYAGLGLEKNGENTTSSVRNEGIERISEQSATEFIGLQRATLDINKQQLIELQQMKGNGESLIAIANNKLAALNAIQVNTANTVARLDLAVQELKYVNKNLGGKFGG